MWGAYIKSVFKWACKLDVTCFQEWTNLQDFSTHVSNPFIFIKRQSQLSCRCKEYAAKLPIYSSHFSCVIPCQKGTISIDSYLPLIRINIAVTPPWTSSLCAISTVCMYPWCTRTLQYIHFIFLIQLHFVAGKKKQKHLSWADLSTVKHLTASRLWGFS